MNYRCRGFFPHLGLSLILVGLSLGPASGCGGGAKSEGTIEDTPVMKKQLEAMKNYGDQYKNLRKSR